MSDASSRRGRDTVLTVEKQAGIATLSFNRPEASNSINSDLRRVLAGALDELAGDRGLRVVVLTSAGDEPFSVGMDVAELATMMPADIEQVGLQLRGIHERLTALHVPVIAAVKGSCLGAGFELALHADIRLARSDARFGLPGINVGLSSGGGALGRLQRVSGIGSAAALALTGGVVTAERAFMLGLVSNVATTPDFWPAVQQLASHFVSLSPVAVSETKRLLRLAAEGRVQDAADASPKALARCFAEGDAQSRLQILIGGRDPEATLH
ncbi:MAG: enoyl-CoA hydratase/isomerase family protein [Alphaproteobacteria bacterium]|jgi:enoyl-CoA hydratase